MPEPDAQPPHRFVTNPLPDGYEPATGFSEFFEASKRAGRDPGGWVLRDLDPRPKWFEQAEGFDTLTRTWNKAAESGEPAWVQRTTYTDHPEHSSKETAVFTRAFWADTLSALVRQGLQAALVIFAALQAGGLTGTVEGVVWSVVIPLVFTLLRKVAAAAVPGLGWQGVVGRAVAAAAGVAAGLAITSWADIVSTDWKAVALTALGAAGAAVANYFLDPPAPAALPSGGSDVPGDRIV